MKLVSWSVFGALVAGILVLSPTPAFAAGENDKLDSYLDKYWGEKRDVKVIQKRLFQKDGRLTLTPYAAVIPNDDFRSYTPLGVRAGYYFSEDLGMELFGSYIQGYNSDLEDFLKGEGFKVEYPQILKWNAGIQGLWSPIHGKISVMSMKLFHFDVHALFGVGALGTEVSQKRGLDKEKRTDVAGHLGAGAKLFIADWAAISLDYRHFFFAATEEIGGVTTPVELSLGFTWFIN